MSYIAFVNVIGSLNVNFRFNSCFISARVLIMIVTLLYYYLLEPLLLRREAGSMAY